MTNYDLLNRVKDLLIDFANKKGISLADDFGTPAEFKRFVIAFTFRQLVDAGLSVREAYDLIFGGGAYETLAESVWNHHNGS